MDATLALQSGAALICLVAAVTLAVKCFNCPQKKGQQNGAKGGDDAPTIVVVSDVCL